MKLIEIRSNKIKWSHKSPAVKLSGINEMKCSEIKWTEL